MRIGLIGVGAWGQKHARVWKELRDEGVIDDILLCDVNEARVRTVGRSLSLPFTSNVGEIVADGKIDAIDIAASTPSHFPIAFSALSDGKHVLVEKPMAQTSAECRKLIAMAKERALTLMTGHIFRYHPAIVELRRMVERGSLGNILTMSTRRESLRYPRKDMGVLMALSIHDVDVYSYLLQAPPIRVSCNIGSHFVPDIEDEAYINIEFPGLHGHIWSSWTCPGQGKVRRLMVVGSRSTVEIDYLRPDEIAVHDVSFEDGHVRNEGLFVRRLPYREPLKEELTDFVRSVDEGREPLASGTVGLQAVWMIEKAKESATKRKTIEMDLEEMCHDQKG